MTGTTAGSEGTDPQEAFFASTRNEGPPPALSAAAAAGARPGETIELAYLRQIRNAVTVIAWIAGLFAVAGLIIGIAAAVQVSHLNSELTGGGGSSNCLSQGGTDPSC